MQGAGWGWRGLSADAGSRTILAASVPQPADLLYLDFRVMHKIICIMDGRTLNSFF